MLGFGSNRCEVQHHRAASITVDSFFYCFCCCLWPFYYSKEVALCPALLVMVIGIIINNTMVALCLYVSPLTIVL